MNEMKLLHLYDFYFLEAIRAGLSMAKSANAELEYKHSFAKLETDVHEAFTLLSDTMAKRIRLYLFASALGEARHAARFTGVYAKEVNGNGRSYVYGKSTEFEISPENTKTLLTIFKQKGWGSSYGGRKWAEIVEAMDLYGKVSNATFIDHTVDLEHNGGTIFSKDTRGTNIKFDPFHDISRFLDLKFAKNILTDGIEASVSSKVYRLLVRYGNVVEPVKLEKIESSLQWLEPFDVEMGKKTLTLNTALERDEEAEEREYDGPTCAECNDGISEDDHEHNPSGECICSYCFEKNYQYCSSCDKVKPDEEMVTCDGETICGECAMDAGASQCYNCGDYSTECIVTEDSNESYCEDCQDSTDYCELCENYYDEIEYHNEHEHEDVYCKTCHCIVGDKTEHILEEHYAPVELQEGEGFDNAYEPLQPLSAIGKKKMSNDDIWEIVYEKEGLQIVKDDYGYCLAPSSMDKWFGKKKIHPIETLAVFSKVLNVLDWTKIADMTDWNMVSESTKKSIYTIVYGG